MLMNNHISTTRVRSIQERPGCLGGLLRLTALKWITDMLQDNVGFGRGGCLGTGCGIIIAFFFAIFACSIIFGTNWFNFGF